MNKRSSWLLIFCVKVVVRFAVGVIVGVSSVRDVQAQRAGAAAAKPAQRRTRQHFDEKPARLDEKPARPIMGILLEERWAVTPGGQNSAIIGMGPGDCNA